MRVLLIKPYNKFRYTIMPPLGLGYLSKVLKQAGFDTLIFDAAKERVPAKKIDSVLREIRPDIVGLSFCSNDYCEIKDLAKAIKEYSSRITSVVGGPHPSALPRETLNEIGEIDYAFVGEGELGLPRLLKREDSLEQIPGLVWRDGNHVRVNSTKTIDNLDLLGATDWEAINPKKYPYNPLGGFSRAFPIAYLLTSRGCPFPCTFCAGKTIYGEKIRFRSTPNLIEEIEMLIKNFHIREIHILDDNFALDKNHVIAFCNGLIERKIKIKFSCSNGIRLESMDEETFRLMRKVGFYSVAIGIESGSDRVLQEMKKMTTTAKIKAKIALARKAGLEVTGLFIIGYPTETEDDILKTIDFARKLSITKAAFTNFLPLPGSAIAEVLKAKGLVSPRDWSSFTYYSVGKSYASAISTARLKKLLKKALFKFYFRPRQFYYILRNINSPNNLFQIVKRSLGQLVS